MKDRQLISNQTLPHNKERDRKRWILKHINKVQNDAVKHFLIPVSSLPESRRHLKYLNEAELLNRIVFGCSSTQWRKQNPELAARGYTIRSHATMERLQLLYILVINNMFYLDQGLSREIRTKKLSTTAAQYSVPTDHLLA